MEEMSDTDIAGVAEQTPNVSLIVAVIYMEATATARRVGFANCAASLLFFQHAFVGAGGKSVAMLDLIISISDRIFAAPVGSIHVGFVRVSFSPVSDLRNVFGRIFLSPVSHRHAVAERALVSASKWFFLSLDKLVQWLFEFAGVASSGRHGLPFLFNGD